MNRRAFLALAVVVSLTGSVVAQDAPSFAGKWSGPWTNSLGEKGESHLKLTEDDNKVLTGTWDGIDVKGKRVNNNTIELRGKNATRSYHLTCTVKGGEMKMKYVVTRLNMEGSYDGKATLTKQ